MLNVSPLRDDEVDAAFPLMQSALPSLTLEAWRGYAAAADGFRGATPFRHGIMVAKAPNGVLRGAFVYAFERRGGDGQALVVRNLMVRHLATPLLGQEMVIEALATSMQELARAHGCDTVVVVLPPEADWEIDYFRKHAYVVAIDETTRSLTPAEN